ncbi:MAG: DUF6443 domain-containing protein [Bacteroidota bacterium]
MKYRLLLHVFVLSGLLVIPMIPDAQSPQVVPAAYSNIHVNYIRSWDVVKPETNSNNITTSSTIQQFKMSTQYFDGLGRPIQNVIKQGSLATGSTAIDLVSPFVYDQFGRETYKYLPFAANNTDGNSSITDGSFKMNPFQQQATFMQGQFSSQGETYFYSKNNFEASSLDIVDKVMAPGNSWVGSNRGTETKYWTNTVTDDIKKWNVTDVANSLGTYAINGYYLAGELYKNISVDEHAKQVIEFKDKEGKVILKKVQLTAIADNGTGGGYSGWLCTYYIYDDLNNLRCVIQPKAVQILSLNSWVFDQATKVICT